MPYWKTQFDQQGFVLIPEILSISDLELSLQLANELISRHRLDDHAVQEAGLSISSVHPDRNPDIQTKQWANEPFILGDLIAMDSRFACIFSNPLLWKYAADLLECPVDEVRFHFANITRKPAGIGPAINWHRDANNKYIAPADHRMIRLLIPLHNMSETNGGTALLPGSHLDKEITDPLHAVYPRVMAGDALAIHAEVLHGGSPNRSKEERDVMVIQFGLQSSDFIYRADEKLSYCDLKEMMIVCKSTSQSIE